MRPIKSTSGFCSDMQPACGLVHVEIMFKANGNMSQPPPFQSHVPHHIKYLFKSLRHAPFNLIVPTQSTSTAPVDLDDHAPPFLLPNYPTSRPHYAAYSLPPPTSSHRHTEPWNRMIIASRTYIKKSVFYLANDFTNEHTHCARPLQYLPHRPLLPLLEPRAD